MMKKHYKKRALKKIFLIFIIISSCFLIGDNIASKKIKPTHTKIIIENLSKNSPMLEMMTRQKITNSLKFRELGVVMERTKHHIYIGNLITNDLMDNKKKISIISDEIERIKKQIYKDIIHYKDYYTSTTSAAPNSEFLSPKRNETLSDLKAIKYAIDNNLEFIVVRYEEDTKLANEKSKIFQYIYYLILSIILTIFISYNTTSRQLKKYNNIFKKFI